MTWVLLVVLLLCSALVSGSETALFGLSGQDVHAFATSTSRFRRRASSLLRRPRYLLLTLLITNTGVNVAIFAVSFVSAEKLSHTHPILASGAGLATLVAVIAFGEILPKSVALAHSRRIAPLVAPVVHALQAALTPVRWLLAAVLVEPVTRLLVGPPPSRSGSGPTVSTDELRALIETSAGQDAFSSTESDMLQAVVGLADVNIRSVMVPRVEIIAASLADHPDTICARFEQSQKAKLPIYDKDLDDVRGLLYARDFHLHRDRPVSSLLRAVDFVPEQANLIQVTRHFRENHSQLAMVVDEFGGVAGLVTLEDVLEEIVGDLPGGDRPDTPLAEPIDENTYRLSGRLSVRVWATLFGFTPADKQVDTLGGLVTAWLGRLPRVGDTVRTGNLVLTGDCVRRRRIDRLVLRREIAAVPGPSAGIEDEHPEPKTSR